MSDDREACVPYGREMWLSTRRMRRVGDSGATREVRTMDSQVNPPVADDYAAYSLDAAWELLDSAGLLPPPEPGREYQLLYMDALAFDGLPEHPRLRLLGFDLSDEHTNRSLLQEPARWLGKLEALVARVNEYGLLSFEDAKRAQILFQEAWPDVPYFTVWALFDVVPSAESAAATP